MQRSCGAGGCLVRWRTEALGEEGFGLGSFLQIRGADLGELDNWREGGSVRGIGEDHIAEGAFRLQGFQFLQGAMKAALVGSKIGLNSGEGLVRAVFDERVDARENEIGLGTRAAENVPARTEDVVEQKLLERALGIELGAQFGSEVVEVSGFAREHDQVLAQSP